LASGIMRSAALQRPEPAQMLSILNDAVGERRLESQYVTMLFAIWNDESRTLQVSNSGAVQPVFCRGGQSSTVLTEGFPLGLFPNVAYEEFTEHVLPGDAIVFVSDGILDAQNAQEEMYGSERLGKVLCGRAGQPAQEVADAILDDVTRFQDGHDRFDDETIIVLRVR
jgi:phosphoserine phosphatase RsbU/P